MSCIRDPVGVRIHLDLEEDPRCDASLSDLPSQHFILRVIVVNVCRGRLLRYLVGYVPPHAIPRGDVRSAKGSCVPRVLPGRRTLSEVPSSKSKMFSLICSLAHTSTSADANCFPGLSLLNSFGSRGGRGYGVHGNRPVGEIGRLTYGGLPRGLRVPVLLRLLSRTRASTTPSGNQNTHQKPAGGHSSDGMTSFILFIGTSRPRNGRHRCRESVQCSNSPPATILGLPWPQHPR